MPCCSTRPARSEGNGLAGVSTVAVGDAGLSRVATDAVQVISLLQRYWPLDNCRQCIVNYDVRMTSRLRPKEKTGRRTPGSGYLPRPRNAGPALTAAAPPSARRKPPEERRTEIAGRQRAGADRGAGGLTCAGRGRSGSCPAWSTTTSDPWRTWSPRRHGGGYGETSAVFRLVEQEATALGRMQALIALLVTRIATTSPALARRLAGQPAPGTACRGERADGGLQRVATSRLRRRRRCSRNDPPLRRPA
jgi:hypothetical protein